MHPKMVQGLALYFSLYSAPCRTVLLTMKSLKINLHPEGRRELNIHEKYEHLEPWFEKINYEKTVPTLVDNGFVLWESRAISKYLVQKYAQKHQKQLYPTDFREQALVDRLLYFDQGVLYQSIYEYFKPQAVLSDYPNPILGAEMERSLQLLSRLVMNNHFALGGAGGPNNLTIADFSFLSSLSHLESMDYSYENHEPICRYVEFLKDFLHFYGECCFEGIGLMKDWSRRNLKYLPNYVTRPVVPYDENFTKA